jgi:hypothetical protein
MPAAAVDIDYSEQPSITLVWHRLKHRVQLGEYADVPKIGRYLILRSIEFEVIKSDTRVPLWVLKFNTEVLGRFDSIEEAKARAQQRGAETAVQMQAEIDAWFPR